MNISAYLAAIDTAPNEDTLKHPVQRLIEEFVQAEGKTPTTVTEERSIFGRHDISLKIDALHVGVVELKEPRKSIDSKHFKGHDKNQHERFLALPNLMYTNGRSWRLYQRPLPEGFKEGEAVFKLELQGEEDAEALKDLLRRFVGWEPQGVGTPRELAKVLAPLTRQLKDRMLTLLTKEDFKEKMSVEEWADRRAEQGTFGALLFHWGEKLMGGKLSPKDFADGYAQVVTYASLLQHFYPHNFKEKHPLLREALSDALSEDIREGLSESIDMLERQIKVIDTKNFANADDLWTYFYEDFLASYDPERRKEYGAYYTPREVVKFQVALTAALLEERLGKTGGFANEGVRVIDPAMGTGAYLTEIIAHTMKDNEYGAAGRKKTGKSLASRLNGLELMIGPYVISTARVAMALGEVYDERANLRLANTLSEPYEKGITSTFGARAMVAEQTAAKRLKTIDELEVVIGNPPYGGGGGDTWLVKSSLYKDFAAQKNSGGNLHNLYIFFLRWAMWRLFEDTRKGMLDKKFEDRLNNKSGVLSYIIPRSFVDKSSFSNVRRRLRQTFDEIYILDLGGDNRGTRKSENVFNIETPVCILVAVRMGDHRDAPAKVFYHAHVHHSREEKLGFLEANAQKPLQNVPWKRVHGDWSSPLMTLVEGDSAKSGSVEDMYGQLPQLENLFIEHIVGMEFGLTWPISPTKELLERRWKYLFSEEESSLFQEENGKFEKPLKNQLFFYGFQASPQWSETAKIPLKNLRNILPPPPPPKIVDISHRTFCKAKILFDGRLARRPSPRLLATYGPHQVYMTTLFKEPLGTGPAASVCALLPDKHHYRGSYAGYAIPLYLDPEATRPNVNEDLLAHLGCTAEEFFCYTYGILSGSAYQERFVKELLMPGPRLPISTDAALFAEVAAAGKRMIAAHTYGERMGEKAPTGKARNEHHEPEGYPEAYHLDLERGHLWIGAQDDVKAAAFDGKLNEEGQRCILITGVAGELMDFALSGFQPLKNWLGYRMKVRSGKKSSPLDDLHPAEWTEEMTIELLELLHLLEFTIEMQPKLKELFERVMAGPLLKEVEYGELSQKAAYERAWDKNNAELAMSPFLREDDPPEKPKRKSKK